MEYVTWVLQSVQDPTIFRTFHTDWFLKIPEKIKACLLNEQIVEIEVFLKTWDRDYPNDLYIHTLSTNINNSSILPTHSLRLLIQIK